MYQRARTVGYQQLSGGALGSRSSRGIRRQWADLERKRKGHTMHTADKPYEVPSYYSEKDRRRGKKHPGHDLLEEMEYGPQQRGPLLRREHGQLGSRKRGMTARERSAYERAIAEPVEEFLAEARGPRHTKRWLGDFSDPAALRARRRQQREVDLAEAQGAQPSPAAPPGSRALFEPGLRGGMRRKAVPETIEAAPAVRGRPQWTATGERQYFTRKEYDAAHRMVPYEERQVAETGAYGAQRASRQPIAKRRELKFRPHKSAAGPRVTGLDRAIVPTGLNYEERERQGAEMVPYRAPERAVAKIPPVTATLAPAFVPPPPDVADEPSGWRSGDTPATMDARAVAIRGRSEKRFEKRQAQESQDLAQERRIALIGGKRGAEDVDAPAEEPARAPAGSRALFEPKLKSVPAPAGSRALFEPKLRPVRRKHTMSGLLGNVRPRSLSPSKKARKRERERYAQQPSTGVQVKDAPEPEADPLAGFEDVPEPDELAGFEDVPPGGFPGEKAAALPATKPAGSKQQPAATVTPARVLEIDEPAPEGPVDDRPAELSSVLRAAKRKARDERRAAIQPAIIMPDIPGVRGSEADATPAQVLEPGKRAAEEVQEEESAKFQVEEDPVAAGMPVGHEYFGRETEAEAAHPGRVKMWGVQAKEPRMRTGPGGKAGYHDISAGGTRVHGYMPTATRPDPFMTQDYSGSWQPTGSEDAAKWSEHAMKNESMRQKAAQANMQAAMPAQAVEEDMPQAPPMSEPFHFQGAGSDHGNVDLSGLKFNMGKTARPEANAFMGRQRRRRAHAGPRSRDPHQQRRAGVPARGRDAGERLPPGSDGRLLWHV